MVKQIRQKHMIKIGYLWISEKFPFKAHFVQGYNVGLNLLKWLQRNEEHIHFGSEAGTNICI